MRRIIVFLMLCTATLAVSATGRFVRVEGENLVRADGSRLYITGTNLGNWLNPEGYMFGFSKTNSGWMIDIMLRQMVGPDETAAFWKAFKDSYITRDDIRFIASTGANTVRLPFNYKLFTDEDYMGLSSAQDGFARVDSLVSWCRDYGLYLILDMHNCPGGQTGDNIDDSYGYPWLFESDTSRRQFIRIWCDIASRYKDEPVILGYELMNEPIAHFFENKDELNEKLEPLYRQAVNAIRKIDSNHVILLGGAQWNSVFSVFSDWKFDANIMYTCHRYGGPATAEAIKDYIEFRDRTGLPMYMGELGHNTDEWQADFVNVLRSNNIGYTFWPYKKVDGSCMSAVVRPEGWDSVVVRFSESVRTTYADIRKARPAQDEALRILRQYIENVKFANCRPQYSYIKSTGLDAGWN